MITYRIYTIGVDGRFANIEVVECADDQEALGKALAQTNAGAVEISTPNALSRGFPPTPQGEVRCTIPPLPAPALFEALHAGRCQLLILILQSLRPDRYGEPKHFDTHPRSRVRRGPARRRQWPRRQTQERAGRSATRSRETSRRGWRSTLRG